VELRTYARIIRRRIWLIVALPLLVLLIALLTQKPTPTTFHASMRLAVGVPPLPVEKGMNFDPRLTSGQASEFLADDFTEVVRGSAFAKAVSKRLPAEISIPPGAIVGATSAEKHHRILYLDISWPDQEQLLAISQAVIQTMREDGGTYLAQLGAADAEVTLLDGPNIAPVGPSLRRRLDIPLRVMLALIAAVALVFFLEYLDDTVRTTADAEALGIPILGEIPGQRSHLPRTRSSTSLRS